MRFGFCTGPEQAQIIDEGGYDYIEFGLAPTLKPLVSRQEVMPALATSLNSVKIVPEVFNVFLPGEVKVVGDEVDALKQERYVEAAFERASSLGAKVVVFGSSGSRKIPDGFPLARAKSQAVAFLNICAPAAQNYGITVAIEPLHSKECNFITSVSEAIELATILDHPNIKVLSDLYHVAMDGQSLQETRNAGSMLAHVHVAHIENRRVPGSGDEGYLLPLFRILKDIDYAGRISVEGNWSGETAGALETLATLKLAWDKA